MPTGANLLASFQARHSAVMTKKKELVTFTRDTETLDTEGRVTAVSSTSDTDVQMIIQPINEEDRKLLGRGVSKEGFMKAYCDPSYDLTNNGDDTTIEVGDRITRSSAYGSTVYRVEVIVSKEPVYGTELYRKILLRRVDA